jgi:tRNA pseudouridine38-40 synthase
MRKIFSDEPLLSKRIALEVEYDGANYFGWQAQKKPAMPTVQAEIEVALSQVGNEPIKVFCAGRTDSGVHATSQVIHFETQALRSEKAWVCGANANLPNNIVVKWAKAVPDEFHARFSATARTYRYIILKSAIRTAILDKKVTVIDGDFSVKAMQEAASFLLGENDFSAYRASGCQSNTPNRFVDYINVTEQGDFIITEIKANAFLLHMVRNIMGVLIEIGLRSKPPVWAKQILESRDRQQAAKTAPPYGLYFVQAHYPDQFLLPVTAKGPSFIQELGSES